MLVLSRSDTVAVASLPGCVAAVADAFRAHGSGGSLGAARLHVSGLGGGVFHLTAGGFQLGDGTGTVGLKLNGRFPPTGGSTDQRVAGVILLADAATGQPVALLDSLLVTSLRTAAVTAVVVEQLAREGARSALVVGAGRQGSAQVDALLAGGRIERLSTFDLDRAKAEALARHAARGGIDARAVEDVHAAARSSDVIVTVTPARAPILERGDVAAGAVVVALGADGPGKQELDPRLLGEARVVVDILEQAADSGELQHALAAGIVTREDVHAELGDLLAGTRPGRTSDDETFVFDGTGTALQDVAAASLLVDAARAQGRGVELSLDA